jgi:hypothetical protein
MSTNYQEPTPADVALSAVVDAARRMGEAEADYAAAIAAATTAGVYWGELRAATALGRDQATNKR